MTPRDKFNDASAPKKKSPLVFKSFTVIVDSAAKSGGVDSAAKSGARKSVNPKVAQCATRITNQMKRLGLARHLHKIRPLYRNDALIVSCTEEAIREIAKISGVKKVSSREKRQSWQGNINGKLKRKGPRKGS